MTAVCLETYNSVPTTSSRSQSRDDFLLEIKSAQAISGSHIDSGKLTALLRVKFGAGAYNVHVCRVCVQSGFDNEKTLTSTASDHEKLLLHHSSEEAFSGTSKRLLYTDPAYVA